MSTCARGCRVLSKQPDGHYCVVCGLKENNQ